MADEIDDLARRLQTTNETLIRHLSQFEEWRRTVDSFMARSDERSTRAPVLLFAAISAVSAALSILVQLWFARMP